MSDDPRVLNAKTGKDLESASFDPARVQKIVLGDLEDEDPRPFDSLETTLEQIFGQADPKLTHLHLWGIQGLESLPQLPDTLICLDLRNCPDLERLSGLPRSLEVLVLEDCPVFRGWPEGNAESLGRLFDLSLKGSSCLKESLVRSLLARTSILKRLDLSGLTELESLDLRPLHSLVDLRLNGCTKLTTLRDVKTKATTFPAELRRIELKETAIGDLPPLSSPGKDKGAGLDYVDLQGMPRLSAFPEFDREHFPRTLYLHGAGLELPPEILGSEDENVAEAVFAHLQGRRKAFHEVKVILIGNGRAGKSSLAKKLVKGEFDPREKTTEGIDFWQLTEFKFEPVGEKGITSKAILNIWDFAGQDLYHNTHRLFYDSKAVFLLCETCSGDGSDPETDENQENKDRRFWDEQHTASYWLSQIKALTGMKDEEIGSRILFIRTKIDRDDEDGEGRGQKIQEFKNRRKKLLNEKIGMIEFSASTGAGLEDLKKWLAKSVSQVLGKKGRREIQENALEVKKALQKLPANTRILSRKDFDQLVREKCPGLEYANQPGILLELFHRSGVLYANQEHLPDDLILDQKWAIEKIYTPFNQDNWAYLKGAEGYFRFGELKGWGWEDLEEKQQTTLLNLMKACGMAISLGGTGVKREEEFLITRALKRIEIRPSRKNGKSSLEIIDEEEKGKLNQIVNELESQETQHIEKISRDKALGLLGKVAALWGRRAELWLWGGQFESYRLEGPDVPVQRTVLRFQWVPCTDAEDGAVDNQPGADGRMDPGDYFGSLWIQRFGPDESFQEAFVNETLNALKGKKGSGKGPGLGDFAAESKKSCIEVGISYSGQIDPGEKYQQELVDSLKKELREYGFEVFEYKEEQDLPESSRESSRKGFMDSLVIRDVVLAILSEKYLKSPWCMYELFRLHERITGVKTGEPHGVSLRAFEEAYFSQGGLVGGRSGGGLDLQQIETFWKTRSKEFFENIRSNPGKTDWPGKKNSYSYSELMEAIFYSQPEQFFLNGFFLGDALGITVGKLGEGDPGALARKWIRDVMVKKVDNPEFFRWAAWRAQVQSNSAFERRNQEKGEEFKIRAMALYNESLIQAKDAKGKKNSPQDTLDKALGEMRERGIFNQIQVQLKSTAQENNRETLAALREFLNQQWVVA